MKILVISPTQSGIGGVAQHVKGLTKFLKTENHTVEIISSENTFTLPIKGFKNTYPHFAGKFALKEAVIKALKEKTDLLEIETFHKNDKPHVKLTNYPNHLSVCSISHKNNEAVAVF